MRDGLNWHSTSRRLRVNRWTRRCRYALAGSRLESLLVLLDLRSSGPDAALKRAQELRSRQPDAAVAIVLEGDVRMVMKDYATAAKAYEDAERIRPDAALAVRTHEAMRLGGLDRPEAPLIRWLALRPEDSRVRAVLGQYYLQTGRSQRAMAELETVSRQAPNNAVALNNLAWLYYTQGDARAEETARRAHEMAPSNAAIADTYGWILLGKQQTARALELLEKAARGRAGQPRDSLSLRSGTGRGRPPCRGAYGIEQGGRGPDRHSLNAPRRKNF